MIDHYRLDTEGLLFGLFGLLLILFGGVSGCGALISLVLSVMLVWKVLIPPDAGGLCPHLDGAAAGGGAHRHD